MAQVDILRDVLDYTLRKFNHSVIGSNIYFVFNNERYAIGKLKRVPNKNEYDGVSIVYISKLKGFIDQCDIDFKDVFIDSKRATINYDSRRDEFLWFESTVPSHRDLRKLAQHVERFIDLVSDFGEKFDDYTGLSVVAAQATLQGLSEQFGVELGAPKVVRNVINDGIDSNFTLPSAQVTKEIKEGKYDVNTKDVNEQIDVDNFNEKDENDGFVDLSEKINPFDEKKPADYINDDFTPTIEIDDSNIEIKDVSDCPDDIERDFDYYINDEDESELKAETSNLEEISKPVDGEGYFNFADNISQKNEETNIEDIMPSEKPEPETVENISIDDYIPEEDTDISLEKTEADVFETPAKPAKKGFFGSLFKSKDKKSSKTAVSQNIDINEENADDETNYLKPVATWNIGSVQDQEDKVVAMLYKAEKDTYKLVIEGEGSMQNFKTVPWERYLDNIYEVEIKDGITNISNNAFKSCSLLEKIEMPDSINLVGNSAFEFCFMLKEVKFSNNLKVICDFAFAGTDCLKEIHLPDSLISICDYAFDMSNDLSIYHSEPKKLRLGCDINITDFVVNDNSKPKISTKNYMF